MTAYMIILAEINDLESFKKYARKAAKLVKEYGGEYIAKGKGLPLEGDWSDETRLVISKWPSIKHAQDFWSSEQYSEIKKIRGGTATVRIQLIEGGDDL